MPANRFYRSVLIFSCFISVFLLLDSLVLPLEKTKAVVVTKSEKAVSKLRVAIYRLETEHNSVTVPYEAYEAIDENDTIVVGRSYLTRKQLQLSVNKKNGKTYNWQIGFVALGGFDFLVFLTVVNLAFLFIGYPLIKRESLRRDLVIFLQVLFLVFLSFYFLFE